MLTESTNASCRCNDAVRFRYLARAETPSMVVHKDLKPKEAFDLFNTLTAKG
jgi:hypothetical protein